MALTADQIRADVAQQLMLQPTDIADDTNLLDAGLDSLAIMRLVDAWRPHGTVSFVDLAKAPTVAAWHALFVALHDSQV